jgi:hypothetical protein
MSSMQRSVASGVVLAGLSTTVQPAAIAGHTLFAISVSGKFHGAMAAMTPTGRLMTKPNEPSGSFRET